LAEVELARPVIAMLHDHGWTVYQEVQIESYGRIADIVAVREPLIWVIEVKAHFGMTVLEQAWLWRPYASYTSIACPHLGKRGNRVATDILKYYGIGFISTDHGTERIPPRLNRHAHHGIRWIKQRLVPEQQTWAEAGNAHGARWTPFQNTAAHLTRYVEGHPGCTLHDAIAAVKTHYHTPNTARSALAQWINRGVIQGITARREGRFLRLYPVTEAVKSHEPDFAGQGDPSSTTGIRQC
jgi:hypothetical protein